MVIETALDLVKKKESIILTVSFQPENVPFYHQVVLFWMQWLQCMFTDNCDLSFCFWVFEKMLTQENCFLFCKKYVKDQ